MIQRAVVRITPHVAGDIGKLGLGRTGFSGFYGRFVDGRAKLAAREMIGSMHCSVHDLRLCRLGSIHFLDDPALAGDEDAI